MANFLQIPTAVKVSLIIVMIGQPVLGVFVGSSMSLQCSGVTCPSNGFSSSRCQCCRPKSKNVVISRRSCCGSQLGGTANPSSAKADSQKANCELTQVRSSSGTSQLKHLDSNSLDSVKQNGCQGFKRATRSATQSHHLNIALIKAVKACDCIASPNQPLPSRRSAADALRGAIAVGSIVDVVANVKILLRFDSGQLMTNATPAHFGQRHLSVWLL